MLKAVIFDMDGVIFDSEPIHYQVDLEIFDQLNIDVSRQEYEQYIGTSNPEMWSDIKDRYGLEESVEELCRLELEQNLEYLKNNQEQPIPGVKELLTELEQEGIRIALASSSPPSYIDLVLSSLAIEEYFEEKVSGETVPRGKPEPDIFLHTAELLGLDPTQAAVIEDSEHGVNAAIKAGMSCIGYRNENSGEQDLSQADLIVDDLRQLNVDRIKGVLNNAQRV